MTARPILSPDLTDAAPVPAAAEDGRRRMVFPVLSLMMVAMVFTQKLALTAGTSSIGLNTFLYVFGLGYLFFRGEVGIVPLRFVLMLATLGLMLVSLVLSPGYSLSALAIVLIMHGPLILQTRLTRAEYMRICDVFQTSMMIVAWIVIGQQVVQYTIGNRFWPNLDRLFPHMLLYPGFAYIRPYGWQSPWLTPNGIFFLEPSIVSGYLAIAAAVEAIWFRRLKRLALYLVAMIAGIAMSGPASLVVGAPFLVWKLSPRVRRMVLLAVGALLVLIAVGVDLKPLDRLNELSDPKSSGYARMVVPFLEIGTELARPDVLWTGHGAGASPTGNDFVQWPVSKLLFEYGLPVAVAFHLLLLVSLLWAPPDRALVAMLLIPFLFFGGGFVAHVSVMPLVLFGSLIRIVPDRDEDAVGPG